MTYSYQLISEKKLPKNFKYPKSYLYYLKYNETQEETSESECWEERSLIRETEDGHRDIDFFYRKLQYEFPEKHFVPFARLYDDLIYCFDGNDSSGDPGIYVIKTFTNQWGIDNQLFTTYYKNFYEWLKNSLKEGVEECSKDVSFPCKDIPTTFIFPKRYLNLIKIYDFHQIDELYNSRFFFTNCIPHEERKAFLNVLKKDNSLIPFMGHFDNGGEVTIGCFFDGNNSTGDPKIYIFDLKNAELLDSYSSFEAFWDNLLILDLMLEKNHR